jgi:hypothetical protein
MFVEEEHDRVIDEARSLVQASRDGHVVHLEALAAAVDALDKLEAAWQDHLALQRQHWENERFLGLLAEGWMPPTS